MNPIDVAVIGAGQAGLSVAYFLRRTQRSVVVLDAEEGPGGAWRHGWPSLHLFSPAAWSSIAGWPMPGRADGTPRASDVVNYLAAYEQRYAMNVQRPAPVLSVTATGKGFTVHTPQGDWAAASVVSATGTWSEPYIPDYPGRTDFAGLQVHSAHYAGPERFVGMKVLVVGGGNSGAQLQAELSTVADATWVTSKEPSFLPDDVDGRVLFERATQRLRAEQDGRVPVPDGGGLGDIVMVPSVKDARSRSALGAVRPFVRMKRSSVVWPDGREQPVDAVVWCTGFRPALRHLLPLRIADSEGRVKLTGTRSDRQPGLWLVGYGDWTGMASATLIGVMRTARSTALEVDAFLP